MSQNLRNLATLLYGERAFNVEQMRRLSVFELNDMKKRIEACRDFVNSVQFLNECQTLFNRVERYADAELMARGE